MNKVFISEGRGIAWSVIAVLKLTIYSYQELGEKSGHRKIISVLLLFSLNNTNTNQNSSLSCA